MALLGTGKRKEEDFKLVGALLSTEVFSYLTLYAMAKSTTKTIIMRKLISSWMAEQKKKVTDDELIDAIATRLNLHWKAEKTTKPIASSVRFLEEVENELTRKGLEETTIAEILLRISK